MIVYIILAVLFFLGSWFIIKMLDILDKVYFYGPILWGFWGEIWDFENLTVISKVLLISCGFVLYITVMFCSLFWMKPIFIQKNKTKREE